MTGGVRWRFSRRPVGGKRREVTNVLRTTRRRPIAADKRGPFRGDARRRFLFSLFDYYYFFFFHVARVRNKSRRSLIMSRSPARRVRVHSLDAGHIHAHRLHTFGRPTRLFVHLYGTCVRAYVRTHTDPREPCVSPSAGTTRIYLRRCIFRTEITMRDAAGRRGVFFVGSHRRIVRPSAVPVVQAHPTKTYVENGGCRFRTQTCNDRYWTSALRKHESPLPRSPRIATG